MFLSLHTSASALTAERLRMDVISNNLANMSTTRTADGGPYQRRTVLLSPRYRTGFASVFRRATAGLFQSDAGAMEGVRVQAVVSDPRPPKLKYEPDHPDADENGYVAYPNIDTVVEMGDLIAASRAYEANIQVFNTNKNIILRTIRLGRG